MTTRDPMETVPTRPAPVTFTATAIGALALAISLVISGYLILGAANRDEPRTEPIVGQSLAGEPNEDSTLSPRSPRREHR